MLGVSLFHFQLSCEKTVCKKNWKPKVHQTATFLVKSLIISLEDTELLAPWVPKNSPSAWKNCWELSVRPLRLEPLLPPDSPLEHPKINQVLESLNWKKFTRQSSPDYGSCVHDFGMLISGKEILTFLVWSIPLQFTLPVAAFRRGLRWRRWSRRTRT